MFAKMKLRQRILLGYLAPLLLLLGAMGLVFVNLQEAGRQAALAEDAHAISGDVRSLQLALITMQSATRGYMLRKDPILYQTFQAGEKEYRKLSESLKLRVKDTQQQDTFRLLLESTQTRAQAQHLMLTRVDEGKAAAAIAQFSTGTNLGQVREMEALADKFNQREAEMLRERQEAGKAALSLAINSIIYGMLAAIALSVAIALWLAAAVSSKIAANATQLSAAVSEIATTIAQHERTASHQAAAATETSATIDELSASSRKSAEQAENAAGVAERAGAATAQGDEATRQAVVAMGSLKDKIGAMAEHILHLGEQTGQIGSIATVLKDLAGQINMLALNAAVEAARAGEHGKGFAVVASEIRKLADESKKSAEQTAVLVADIQKATNSSIMMTEEGTHTVIEVTQLVQKVAELFANLASLAGSANENAQQVMLNARQQSAAFS